MALSPHLPHFAQSISTSSYSRRLVWSRCSGHPHQHCLTTILESLAFQTSVTCFANPWICILQWTSVSSARERFSNMQLFLPQANIVKDEALNGSAILDIIFC